MLKNDSIILGSGALSISAILGYLIAFEGLELEEAIRLVDRKRHVALPPDVLRHLHEVPPTFIRTSSVAIAHGEKMGFSTPSLVYKMQILRDSIQKHIRAYALESALKWGC
jgi:hypothetical protein